MVEDIPQRGKVIVALCAVLEKAFPLSRDLDQEAVQKVMSQLKISGYNRDVVMSVSNDAKKIGRQQISEAVEKTERGDDS